MLRHLMGYVINGYACRRVVLDPSSMGDVYYITPTALLLESFLIPNLESTWSLSCQFSQFRVNLVVLRSIFPI